MQSPKGANQDGGEERGGCFGERRSVPLQEHHFLDHSFQPRSDKVAPEFVACGAHVELILHIEFRAGELIASDHGGRDIDAIDAGVVGSDLSEGGVGPLHFRPLSPEGGTGFDGEEEELAAGEFALEFLDEAEGVCDDVLCASAMPEIVLAGVEHESLRLIGEDEAIEVVEGVQEARATKASIEALVMVGGEVFFQAPEANA